VGFVIAAAAVLAELAFKQLEETPYLLVYPAIVLATSVAGRAAGVTAVLTAGFGVASWVLPPTTSIAVAARRDVLELGVFIGVALLLVDFLVRKKRALEEARAARKIAESATAARDTVLAVVAHDLRNPLQTIRLSADLLTSWAVARGERTETQLRRIARSAELASRLVDGVLDTASLTAGRLQVEATEGSLSALVDETLAPFKPHADARAIQLELPTGEETQGGIVCDHDRMVQVLSNLVGNALKYTPRGGRVAVHVQRVPEGVRFEVMDTGTGMSREELAHAFERLWHGEDPGHGLGLGLWIAKGLLEAHGARIEAVSERGKGTKIAFVLPQPPAAVH
jgi:signal transduction histidine kinase